MKKIRQKNLETACALCGQTTARVIMTNRVFGHGADMVLIENIPVHTCRNCNSQYIDAATLDAIDVIRKNPAAHAHKRSIDTASLAA
ncbi:MAG: YgiT-type zinc finger protein [Blastocatellia bacterium]